MRPSLRLNPARALPVCLARWAFYLRLAAILHPGADSAGPFRSRRVGFQALRRREGVAWLRPATPQRRRSQLVSVLKPAGLEPLSRCPRKAPDLRQQLLSVRRPRPRCDQVHSREKGPAVVPRHAGPSRPEVYPSGRSSAASAARRNHCARVRPAAAAAASNRRISSTGYRQSTRPPTNGRPSPGRGARRRPCSAITAGARARSSSTQTAQEPSGRPRCSHTSHPG